jgi:ribosomal protein S18 acetylase RimI-like enzyme
MIRAATNDDASRLLDLEAMLFDNSMAPSLFERERTIGRCLVIGDPVFAYALIREQPEVIDLLRLGVLPTEQGKGYGRQLVEHVLALGKDTMLTVRKNNRQALGLYSSLGFRIVGELHEHGTTGWVMRRSLPAPYPR